MSFEWSHLPNASHIDRILESLRKHHDIWNADSDAAWNAAMNETCNAARYAARYAARDAAWIAARDAAWYATWAAAWDAGRVAAREAAFNAGRVAIAALVAWDDSAQFLEMDGDALEIYARLSDDPRAILLLPAVRVFERIKELETL